jgi:hypothetical protein
VSLEDAFWARSNCHAQNIGLSELVSRIAKDRQNKNLSRVPIGIYAVVTAVISIWSALLLLDQTNKDIAHEVNYGNV